MQIRFSGVKTLQPLHDVTKDNVRSIGMTLQLTDDTAGNDLTDYRSFADKTGKVEFKLAFPAKGEGFAWATVKQGQARRILSKAERYLFRVLIGRIDDKEVSRPMKLTLWQYLTKRYMPGGQRD